MLAKRIILTLLLFFAFPLCAHANESFRGWCEQGAQPVVTSGLTSSTQVQVSHPLCTVTVYVHGGGLATIYSDNSGTVLANPFTADTDGQYIFYADNGRYDVTMTAAGFTQPITYSDVLLCDLATPSGFCTGGGGGGGSGTVTNFSSGNLPPLFTTSVANPTTTPTQSFTLSNAGPYTVFGNPVGGTGVPSYYQLTQSFVTGGDESASLPNSRQVVSGINTTPNTSVTNRISINAVQQYLNNGTLIGAEPALNLIPGTNITISPFTDTAGVRVNATFNSVQQYQNNGTPVGAEPILNLIPGTNITFSPVTDAGGKVSYTINSSGGGGSGCSVGSLSDTWVLSIHPAATCYGSANFTWDDGSSKQNLQAGLSNTLGTQDTFILGQSNSLLHATNSMILGDSSSGTASGDTFKYIFGPFNAIDNVNINNDAMVTIGSFNTTGDPGTNNSGGADVLTFGEFNNDYNSEYTNVLGYDNSIGALGASGSQKWMQLAGYFNDINTFDGNGTLQHIGVWGDSNSINASSHGTVGEGYTLGFTNHIDTTTAATAAFLFGFDNSADSTPSADIGEYGQSNSATNIIVGTHGLSNDSTIVGNQNVLTNVGLGFASGIANNLHDCVQCLVYGIGEDFATTDALGIGVDATDGVGGGTPEIVITHGHIKFNAPLVMDPSYIQNVAQAFASLPTCDAGHTGAFATVNDSTTNQFGATITGSGANKVGAYCNGTNWSVAAGGATSGTGTVTTTGSPANTYLAGFSGASSITGTSAATIDGSGNVVVASLTDSALTPGNCVQASTAGLLTTTGSACGSSGGSVTTTGSPASGNLAAFSGASSITSGDLSGDVTTAGTLAATVLKLRGLTLPTLAASTGVLYDNAGTLSLSTSASIFTTGTLPCAQEPARTGDTTAPSGSCVNTTVKVNGGAIPTSATVLGSNGSNQIVSATLQGNGAKVQLSTGSTVTNDCVKFDASGNTVDSGAGCGGVGTVTSFSAGALSPLFTTSVATATTTPALTFSLSTAAADTVFANCTGSTAAPSYCSIIEAMLPAATVFTDQSATFGAHTYDFSGATLVKARVGAGLTTSANGDFGYDSTNSNWHDWTNGADALRGEWSATPTTGNCVKSTVSSSTVSLTDAGGPCGVTNSGTQYAFGIYATAGTAISSGPTPPSTKGDFDCGYHLSTDAAATPSCPQSGLGGRAVAGSTSTDTTLFTDNLTVIHHTQSASASVAITLPTPTTLENANFADRWCNHSTHADTITPTTWTIQLDQTVAGSSATIPGGVCMSIKPDPAGSNWLADSVVSLAYLAGTPAIGTPSSLTLTNATGLPAASVVAGALANGMTATTQAGASADTKVATDAYVDAHFIGSGTASLGTSSISSGACATVVTVSATGVASTDVIQFTPNASIKAVTGYTPATAGGLSITAYPTANNVNFDVCNWSTGSITPGAVTLNWRVSR